MIKRVQGQKIKLEGFNNLTRSLSFNIYDICYARSRESQIEYLEYIDEEYKPPVMSPTHDPGTGREIREGLNAHQGYHYNAGKTLVSPQTQYQKAELVETQAFGRVLLLYGATQVSEKWEYRYHEPMVHPALFAPDLIVTEAESLPLGRIITDGQPDFPDSFER